MATRPGPSQSALIPAAELAWRGDQPYSSRFDDIYHAADGPEEVGRVFLGPTDFPDICRRRATSEKAATQRVLVGELGFGSGLNFMVAAGECLRAGCRLHFISFEAAPIRPAEFQLLAGKRGGRHPLYRELASQYPPLIRGWHRRSLAEGRIVLSTFWGYAAAGLADIVERQQNPVDVWFLDGFAPDRNPGMWAPELFLQMAALSTRGTRVATFTAAGKVRRGLEAAGFQMQRVDQRPHKRESLSGIFADSPSGKGEKQAGGLKSQLSIPSQVRVAGAGLAGASAARQLAEAGIAVQVYDAAARETPGAPEHAQIDGSKPRPGSRLDATVLHARLLADGSPAATLRCHSFLFAAAFLARFPNIRRSGVLQLPGPGQGIDRLEAIADAYQASGSWLQMVDRAKARDLTRWPVESGGLWFGNGGVVDTPALCRSLLDHPRIEVIPEHIHPPLDATPLILACAAECRSFASAGYLEIAAVQGQLDLVALPELPSAPIVGNGYLAPAGALLVAGATYEYQPWDPERATEQNMHQLGQRPFQWRRRIRGTRAVSSDRLPVAGRLYDIDQAPVSGQLVSTGHGSMGNVTSHYAGAVVSAQLLGDFPPLTTTLEAALSPLRFRQRQARRGYRHGTRA